MRILGFSERWEKLNHLEFTTFRFARKDRDWGVGEQVQIVLNPRSKERCVLGIAEIVAKEARCMARYGSKLTCPKITNEEAIADGFQDKFNHHGKIEAYFQMWDWLWSIYGGRRLLDEPMNKLTLRWIERI